MFARAITIAVGSCAGILLVVAAFPEVPVRRAVGDREIASARLEEKALPARIALESVSSPRSGLELELEAERLSRSWRGEDKRRAIRLLEKRLLSHRDLADDVLEAETRLRLGELYHALGLARAALPYYRSALDARGRTASITVRAHAGASRALLTLDDFQQGLGHAQQAFEASRGSDPAVRAEGLLSLAYAQFERRELRESLAVLQEALSLANGRCTGAIRAAVLLQMGFTFSDDSEEWRALTAFDEALGLARQVADRRTEAFALMGLGHTHSKIGEKQQALTLYMEAAPLFEQMDDPHGTASLYTGMGLVYDELGDYRDAREYYTRALRLSERLESPMTRMANLIHLGRTHAAMGDPVAALSAFRTAAEGVKDGPYQVLRSVVLGHIGDVLEGLGRGEEAIEAYAEALRLSRVSGHARGEADILISLGAIDLRNGDVARATSRFERALALSRRTKSRFAESKALANLGRAERAAGNFDEALTRTEQALAVIEELRTKISSYRLRASYLASVRDLQAFHIDLLMELYEERDDSRFAEDAFLATEGAKARALLDQLNHGSRTEPGLDPALLQYEHRLQERIRAEAAAHPRDRRQPLDGREEEASASLDELLRELDRVRAVLASRDAEKLAVTPSVVGLEDLRPYLDAQTAMLAYFLGDDASYLWVVTPSTLTVHPLPPRAAIESAAYEVQTLLTSWNQGTAATAKQRHELLLQMDHRYGPVASSLSRTLLGDALSKLDVDVKRLIVVGDGPLHQIPFSALPLPCKECSTENAPLVGRYEIVRLPSASSLKVLSERGTSRRGTEKKLAVLADPVFDPSDPRVATRRLNWGTARFALEMSAGQARGSSSVERGQSPGASSYPRLLSSRLEAKRVLALVEPDQRLEALGFDANRALVSSGELRNYEIVHFATHGVLNTDRPELSGIVLSLFDSRGKEQDGFLRMHDLYDLDLPVRLVVLSACNTGLGTEIRGEGVIGLVRGFLAAGAGGVVASYWSVDDEATSELMKRFYVNLLTHQLPPARALQLAQNSLRSERRWQSPVYWAAFELHGP